MLLCNCIMSDDSRSIIFGLIEFRILSCEYFSRIVTTKSVACDKLDRINIS